MEKAFTVVLAILIWTVVSWPADGAVDAGCNNSVSLGFLEDVVSQQMTLILSLQTSLEAEKNRAAAADQYLENKLTAADNEITTLQAKLNRSAMAVAFTARFRDDDWSNGGIIVGNKSPLRFDDVVYNAGDGYDPQTGIFTAPLAGTYSFFLNLMTHETGRVAIVKNGHVLDLVFSRSGNTQGATQVMTHLEVGDKVWVRHYDTTALRGAWYTVFTGYLLHAD